MTGTVDVDGLLGAWGASVRLGDDDAEAIRRAIVAEPVDVLGASWWKNLSAQVSSAIVLANKAAGPAVRSV